MKPFVIGSSSPAGGADVRAVIAESGTRRFRVYALTFIAWLITVAIISWLMGTFSEPTLQPDYPQTVEQGAQR